ncbi:hypothetical protein BGZ63DRAFT_377865 [Mariannaea sp. PMI_226]|nr:hypothetical protein BGZ63DRAFT_377865 [Mariannaea sp. PMI_226]
MWIALRQCTFLLLRRGRGMEGGHKIMKDDVLMAVIGLYEFQVVDSAVVRRASLQQMSASLINRWKMWGHLKFKVTQDGRNRTMVHNYHDTYIRDIWLVING